MYNIKISEEFYNDVADTVIYISNILYNVDAAKNFKSRINDAIGKVAKNPKINSQLKTNQILEYEYRYVYVGNYYLIYHYDEENIYITRLIYSKRDFDNLRI